MLYRNLFPRDLFAELDRIQRDVQQAFDNPPNIRGVGRGGYPALNVGTTPQSVEVYAFAPGLEPSAIQVDYDRGALTLAGERKRVVAGGDERSTLHMNERFDGRFRRVVSLPDDIDPNAITADYRDGVLHVSLKRRESAQPRRIEVR